MFSYQWFLENDRDTVERLTSVKDIKWYIDNFIKDNKDVLDNMVLVGENVDEINWLYDFYNRVIPKYGERGIQFICSAWFLAIYI